MGSSTCSRSTLRYIGPSSLGWSRPRGLADGRLARGAETPEDDLRLVDREAVVVGRGQAGRLADGAVDVLRRAAGAADDVMVVVADARLVEGGAAAGLVSPEQPGAGQHVEDVVDGLRGERPDALARLGADPLGAGVPAEPIDRR